MSARWRPNWREYALLMRLDKPIGIYLLLWPTLWALWIAADGYPDRNVLLVFVVGVVLMRSAGCVINDYADRHVDGAVARTRERPLAAGRVQAWEALTLFAVLGLMAFVLVLSMNRLTIGLAVVGVLLAASYPFAKRFHNLPQLHLGIAFAWAVPMAYAAQRDSFNIDAVILFAATVLWTIAYDTMYAMVDREDDLRIGVKSTAILFGRHDRLIIALLQLSCLALLLWIGLRHGLGLHYYSSLLGAAILAGYQQWLIRGRQREACFRAFLNNHYFGLLVFLGLFLSYLPSA